jgi:hypothetical protein
MANCFKNVSTPGFVMLKAAGTFTIARSLV